MQILFATLLSAFVHMYALAETPVHPGSLHKVITATTNAYQGERTEIWVQCNAKGDLEAVILEEYNLTEPLRQTHVFTLEQINSEDGATLKTQLTVALLTLKGRRLGPQGGAVDLEFRKSNWFSDTGKIPLSLKRDKDQWHAYTSAPSAPGRSDEKVVNELHIQVWTGFGFGIDGIEIK